MKHSSVVCLDTDMRKAWHGQHVGVAASLVASACLKQSLPRQVNLMIAQDKVRNNAGGSMRKTSSPYKKLLTAKDGDVFVLKGEKFTANTMKGYRWINGEIFLTSKDRKNDEGYLNIHVRNKGQVAVFKRQELINMLRSGNYTVS